MFIKEDLHSDAAALASMVFPLPGGPYNKIPKRNIQRGHDHNATRGGYPSVVLSDR